MYFVYFLKSQKHPNQTYVGYTTDVEKRLETHNNGGSPHTAKYKPWELQCFLGFKEKQHALNFETYLKSHSGKAFASKRFF